MNLKVVYDNNPFDERLGMGWGFSCYVEGIERTLLFDTGGDGTILLDNLEKSGISPADIDTVFLSHIHGDHTGGLGALLERNPDLRVIMPESFPEEFKEGVEAAGAELVQVGRPCKLMDGVHSTGQMVGPPYEQSLVVETSRGTVVVTGCAHPGIVDIVRQAKEITGGPIYLVMGGFHLRSYGRSALESIVEDFRLLGVEKVGPCHCSGDLAREVFSSAYGDDYIEIGVGSEVSIR